MISDIKYWFRGQSQIMIFGFWFTMIGFLAFLPAVLGEESLPSSDDCIIE